MDDDGWEARMAARARERAKKRETEEAEQQRAALESLGRLPAWLNDHHQVSVDGTTVWVFPSNRCICCGTPKDICCFAYPPDYVAPPEPEWPFTYEHCPLCRQERNVSGATWSDTFDRIGSVPLSTDYDQRTAPWNPGRLLALGEAEPPSARCLACGNTVTLQPGESIPYGDPRLCEHMGQKP